MTHDAAIWCRPPAGTEPGTPCWLYRDAPGEPREWCAMAWMGDNRDCWAVIYDHGANRVARAGWRFHCVAQVPGEGE